MDRSFTLAGLDVMPESEHPDTSPDAWFIAVANGSSYECSPSSSGTCFGLRGHRSTSSVTLPTSNTMNATFNGVCIVGLTSKINARNTMNAKRAHEALAEVFMSAADRERI